MAKWLSKARRAMEKGGTVGGFTRQAKAAGSTVPKYAARVLSTPSAHTKRTVRRARFARTMEEIGAKRTGHQLPPILKVTSTRKRKQRRTRRTKKAA